MKGLMRVVGCLSLCAGVCLAGTGPKDVDLAKTLGVRNAAKALVVLGTSGTFTEGMEKDKVFDGDEDTFFDAKFEGKGAWAGFQTTRPMVPTRIRYRGRFGYESRAAACVLQAANAADFSDAVNLHVVAPPPNWHGSEWVEVSLDWSAVRGGARTFSFFRVFSPSNRTGFEPGACCGNFSEVVFFGTESLPKSSVPPEKATAAAPAAKVARVPGTSEPNDWENPAVFEINRLPARTFTVPLARVDDALTDELEPASPWSLSLNGNWKISWAGNPKLRVNRFWAADFDDSLWGEVDVPSCLETRGFGSPQYTNADYPHQAKWPTIRNCETGADDYNPVASYRRRFSVPAAWRGRRVVLRFDGVCSAYYVWVNGERVGYAEDSMMPSEFDVTDLLRPFGEKGSDGNVLAVEVYRWSDGSFLEDQDGFRFHGIFRDVTVWSMPKGGIWNFEVKATVCNGYRDGALEVTGCDGCTAVLYDADSRKVGTFATGSGKLEIPGVRLWSAEDPYLYTLVLTQPNTGDIRMRRVGFKEQKIEGKRLVVNGRPLKIKGVNRCETSPDGGRTVTRAEMLKDIRMFKRFNIDTVRTSHYPNHRFWYDLCDRYGVYVVAEANLETHGFYNAKDDPANHVEWMEPILARNVRHVQAYRNHPSVMFWSVGNEVRSGVAVTNALAVIRRMDPSRPRTGNVDFVPGFLDVFGGGYTPPSWLEERGREGRHAVFFIEYAHSMGNALGTFAAYWDVFEKYDNLIGGCVWDWADQSVWKYTDRVDPKTGERERYLGYGGDWDERPNSGNFCVNGIVDPLRHVTPKLVEVAHVHRPLVVTRGEDGTLELWNRQAFTFADAADGSWELLEDGAVVDRGTFRVPHLAPQTRGALALPTSPKFVARGQEWLLNVNFATKAATAWAEKGWVVARNQVRLTKPRAQALVEADRTPPPKDGAVRVDADDARVVRVWAGTTKAVFDRKSGTLCELVMDGVAVMRDPAPGLAAGPRLTCMRAFVDNDSWLRDSFIRAGLTQLHHHPSRIVVEGADTIRVVTAVDGTKSAGFRHEQTWKFLPDGSIELHNVSTPHGTMPVQLPRFGLSLKLVPALEHMTYYGRGPYENYVDRCTGSLLGIWTSTVTDQYVAYVRPQDNGYKTDVRWVAFTDDAGRGVCFSASRPLAVQALHFTADELDRARHRGPAFGTGEWRIASPLPPHDEVCLNLDIRQCGLGGASCGPRPLEEHLFPTRKEEWTVRITRAGRR